MPPMIPVKYWLGPYRRITEGGEGYWAPPAGAFASVDLRTLPAMAATLTIDGGGLFVAPASEDLGGDYVEIGDSLEAEGTRTPWLDRIGVEPSGDTVLDRLWSCLTDQSDPTGQAAPRTLMPNSRSRLELHLAGHSLVKSEPYTPNHPIAGKVEAIVQDVIRRADPQMRGKLLHAMAQKLRATDAKAIERLIPRGVGKVKPEKPETSFSDDFNRAGPGLGANWTDSGLLSIVASSYVLANANAAWAFWNTAFSVDDMTSSVIILDTNAEIDAGESQSGYVRMDGVGDDDGYYVVLRRSTTPGYIRAAKRVGGSPSVIATSNSQAPAQNDRIGVSIDGSTMTASLNGTTHLTHVDTSILGNLYVGTRCNNGAQYDDWQASDIVAGGGGPSPHHIRRSNSMAGGFAA